MIIIFLHLFRYFINLQIYLYYFLNIFSLVISKDLYLRLAKFRELFFRDKWNIKSTHCLCRVFKSKKLCLKIKLLLLAKKRV